MRNSCGVFHFFSDAFAVRRICPMSWTHYNSSCYVASSSKLSWVSARANCVSQGSDLIYIQSGSENLFALGFVGRVDFYIGYNDIAKEGVWVWSKPGVVTRYTNWQPGEPNNHVHPNAPEGEDCGNVYGATGEWNDYPCHQALDFVCKRPGETNHTSRA